MGKKGKKGVHKKHTHLEKKADDRLDQPEPSKITFALVASIILLLGFYAIKDYSDVSVGKAYEVLFEDGEFDENAEIELLSNVPERVLLRVDDVVKKAQIEFTGSGRDLTISIDDDEIFTSTGSFTGENPLIDSFDIASEINERCSRYPCVVPVFITSKSQGSLTLTRIDIEVGELAEEELIINVETSKDYYEIGQVVKLKSIESSSSSGGGGGGGSPASITGAIVYSESSKDSNEASAVTEGEDVITSQGIFKNRATGTLPKYQGYIIEFEEKPILELKKEIGNEIEIQKKVIGGLNADIISMEENLPNRIKQQENKITDLHERLRRDISSVGATVQGSKSKVINEYKKVFSGTALDISDVEAKRLKELDYVKEVYPNYEVNITLMDSVPLINADDVWQLDEDGNDCSVSGKQCLTGEGTTIGIMDTGVDYTHPDLGGCFGPECKVIGGYDFVNNDDDPMDDQGHGTHVAATAAGKGILDGVAPDANIVAYKVLDSFGGGNNDDIIAAIERSVDPNQDGNFDDHLDIISLSLGGFGNPDDPQSIAIDNAVDSGVVAVIAAGNDGPNPGTIGSPGTAKKAITVGATYKKDYDGTFWPEKNGGDINPKKNQITVFSSRGPVVWDENTIIKPDIVAPGAFICAARFDSIYPEGEHPYYKPCLDEEHVLLAGTSMATPIVSGAVALLKQKNPDWSPLEIKMALRNTALDINEPTIFQGYGRLDILRAIQVDNKPPLAILGTLESLEEIIDISGTATGENFVKYTLDYGFGLDPGEWNNIVSSTSSVTSGLLYSGFDTSLLSEGDNIIRLVVEVSDGQLSEDRNIVIVNNVKLTQPLEGDITGNLIEIVGTTKGNGFRDYVLEYGEGENPSEWSVEGVSLINDGKNAITNGLLGTFDASSLDESGYYAIRLTVNYENRQEQEYIRNIYFDSDLMRGWPIKFQNVVSYYNSPTVADVNNDGNFEIIFGSDNKGESFVNVYDHKGDSLDGWPQPIIGFAQSGISVGDINNDGFKEIVATNGGKKQIYVWNFKGELLWNKQLEDKSHVCTVLDDINNDDFLEIIAYTIDSKIFVLDNLGNNIIGWPQEVGGFDVPGLRCPAIADFDGDGLKEIVMTKQIDAGFEPGDIWRKFKGSLTVYNHDGSIRWVKNWPQETQDTKYYSYGPRTSPVIGDINNDGELEIVVSHEVFNANDFNDRIYKNRYIVYDKKGDVVPGWPVDTDTLGDLHISPVIANIDDDPELEIIGQGKKDIYVWNHDGTLLFNPIEINPDILGESIIGTPSVADVTGDGNPDIIVFSKKNCRIAHCEPDFKLYIINNDGTLYQQNWPKIIKGYIDNAPAIYDIDNDGKTNIVFYDSTYMYVWDLETDYDQSTMEWPTYRHDHQLTGNYNFGFIEPKPKSRLENTGEEIIFGTLTLKIQKWNEDQWIDEKIIFEDSGELGSGEIVSLAEIWEESGSYTASDAGLFRVFAEFSYDGKEISDVYQFDVIGEEPVCTDSDGGKNYYVKGTTSGPEWSTEKFVTKNDFCITEGEKAGRLSENYCWFGQVADESVECPNGCKDGACIVIEGEAWKVGTPKNTLELSENLKTGTNQESIGTLLSELADKFIGEDELPILLNDNTASNVKSDAPYNQKLFFEDLDTGYVLVTENNDDVINDFLYFKSGSQISRYNLEFTTAFESGVYDDAVTPDENGDYLTDFEDVKIEILGKDYIIVKARRNAGQNSQIQLFLMGGAVKDTLLKEETKTYTISGVDYEVTLAFVDADSAKFTVNNKETLDMEKGDIDFLSDGTVIGVSEIVSQDFAGGIHSSTFFLGAYRIKLEDTDITDEQSSNPLMINKESVDSAKVIIEGTDDDVTFKLNRVHVKMFAEDDFYVPAGGKLSENPELDDPEVLFTENWDISYNGLTDEIIEEIKIVTSGNKKYRLKFMDGDRNQVNLPLIEAVGPSEIVFGEINKDLIIQEGKKITKKDYLILSNEGNENGRRETFALQYMGADKLTADNPSIKFKILGSGETIEGDISADIITKIIIDGEELTVAELVNIEGFRVYNASSTESNDFEIYFDLNADGNIGDNKVGINTPFGASIDLVHNNDNLVTLTLNTPHEDDYDNLKPTPFIFELSADESGFVEITKSQDMLHNFLVPEGSLDQHAVSSYGATAKLDVFGTDPEELTFFYQKNQILPKVFIIAKETEGPEPEPGQCETSLDCPIYHRCEEGVCVGFCDVGVPSEEEEEDKEAGSSGSQSSIMTQLNSLGYDVTGQADIPDYRVQKTGDKIIFSSESETHVFDQEFDSFVLSDSKGNKMEVRKSTQKSSTSASHIVEFEEKPLIAAKYEIEKDLGIEAEIKSPPKNIKEKIESRMNRHRQRLKEVKETAIKEMLEVNPDIESRIIDSYKNVFNGISVDISEEEVLEIKNLMSVKNVYRNEEVHTVLMESVNQINADEVWKLLDENDLPITGKGVTIGVIDTGVDYTHVDLGGCIGLECKVIGGYDFVNNDNDPIDDQGHGTHVAATAAGKGILKGVAPDAKVVAYKVLDSFGGGNWDDIIEAIERSVDPNQDGNFEDHLDVISLSLGGPGNPDDPISTAIDNAVDSGVVAVIAAGNSGPSPETIGSPGTARKAITVGAVDRCDSIAGFSSRGPVSWEGGVLLKPDLTAPGVNICAAQWENSWSSSQCLDTEHTAISGTSMATPHVSGAAALLLQAHPEWTPDDIKSALMSTSLDLGLDALTQGSGRINVLNAHNAKITTEPQSISFEVKAGQSSHVETISVKNLAEEQVTLTLSIPELKDQKGQSHDFASLSTNELVIDGGSIASFDFIVDIPNEAEGLFTGKIIITRDTTKYTIPFSFERISRLTLKAIDIDTDNELFPDFYLHKDLSSLESAFNGLDFVGDNFTFKVTSGTYTVYAIGQESGFDYILMGSIEVLPASKIQLDLEISDAQKYNVVAESLQRVPLSLYQWTFGFNTYDSGGIQSVFYQDPTLSNKTMYISNKPDNGFDTDILLYYHGVPARARDLK